ncbi:MAG TPA: hypothetical protein VI732_02635 [Alphaproteobacteria bacterium]|nr:hypothetical protein [Alphaproteobacteria bacterium]
MKQRRIRVAMTRAAVFSLGLAGAIFPGSAAAETVVITRADCQRLVRHVPAPDVEYQAGKDAYGRDVVPADLNGGYGDIKPPEVITFQLKVNLRNFQGGPEADAQAASAAVGASTKAATAASLALIAASTAETAAAADPGNAELAAAATETRAAATAANAAVTAGDKSAAAANAANAAAAASALAPGDPDLAEAAQAVGTAAQDAAQANDALNRQFRSAERIGQFYGEPVVGNVTVKGDQVYFNDRPILDPEQAELAAACQKVLKPQK